MPDWANAVPSATPAATGNSTGRQARARRASAAVQDAYLGSGREALFTDTAPATGQGV